MSGIFAQIDGGFNLFVHLFQNIYVCTWNLSKNVKHACCLIAWTEEVFHIVGGQDPSVTGLLFVFHLQNDKRKPLQKTKQTLHGKKNND